MLLRRFVLKIMLFFSPFLLLTTFVMVRDPHKIFFSYDNYYSSDEFILPNREHVALQTYLKHYEQEQFNAFIFGSSRVFSIPLEQWGSYLPSDAKPYLFNAFGDGVYGLRNKLRLLTELEQPLRYALVGVDVQWLNTVENRTGVIDKSPPLLSQESHFAFYLNYLNALLDGRFALSYLDYTCFQTHRDYMEPYISSLPIKNVYDTINSSLIRHQADIAIAKDSVAYYKNVRASFPPKRAERPFKSWLSPQAAPLLREIKAYFEQHGTQYWIVLHPDYEQYSLSPAIRTLLDDIFGKENIHDFSGKHPYSQPMGNFYDKAHYRMFIGGEMLKDIYEK